MTLWLAIIALVLVVNESITPMAIIVATHVDDNEQRAAVEQAGPASVLDFWCARRARTRHGRANPPPKLPLKFLLTCNSALRAPKSERARAKHHLFANEETNALIRVAMPTVDDRSPPTENRRPTREP